MKLTVSVVIPVKDSEKTLEKCLQSLCAEKEQIHEIIIVDDGSTDSSLHIARKFPLTSIIHTEESHRGVARARNHGARYASGDIVLFIDSDVLLNPGSITLLGSTFQDPRVNAAVGLLDPDSFYRNFASDYKNLWMHYTYKILPRETSLFYTSIAAIRRSLFIEIGGFDEAYRKPGLEDTAFGNTLYARGNTVRLVPELQAIHVKYYSLADVLKLDYFRAKALVKIQLRKGLHGLKSGNKSSVPKSFILSIIPGCLASILILAALLLHHVALLAASLLMAVLTSLLNQGFFFFLAGSRGWFFTFKAMLFLIIDSNILMLGVVTAIIEYLLGKRY